ncbi:hypothetical protein ZIOFF_047143 [Zingiber officinale]|uniref:Uncharacterized protein n=1 Tax=Zingiber officinale TaxID=94328 RepID=A0A8J5FMF1_ZINOF|nr:hypothetical protein ZIOFF_047143 [Zingiber officinale]
MKNSFSPERSSVKNLGSKTHVRKQKPKDSSLLRHYQGLAASSTSSPPTSLILFLYPIGRGQASSSTSISSTSDANAHNRSFILESASHLISSTIFLIADEKIRRGEFIHPFDNLFLFRFEEKSSFSIDEQPSTSSIAFVDRLAIGEAPSNNPLSTSDSKRRAIFRSVSTTLGYFYLCWIIDKAIAEMEDVSISLKGYPEIHAALAASLYANKHAALLAENQFTIATL